ncbi:MAG: hypothetical protein DSZ24_03940 [Thermodesulfatator sp.]|nr:MAG: hypothetical protein DSZ24_03940 [Thermodesulfatator sp.]
MDLFSRLVAWVAVLSWPVIPLFWIPLHLLPSFAKRLGWAYYLLTFGLWLLLADLFWATRLATLWAPFSFPVILKVVGGLGVLAGALLQGLCALWLRGQIVGRGILNPRPEDRLVTQGPFRYLRHPTYLAHALFFWGAFFFSGYPTVALVALVDLILTWLVIVPREERELEERFGEAWRDYTRRTPRVFPRWRSS